MSKRRDGPKNPFSRQKAPTRAVSQQTSLPQANFNLKQAEFAQTLSPLIEQGLKQAFNSRRELIVHEMVRLMKETGLGQNIAQQNGVDSASEWVGIESLSRLRSIVGGRFDNIKKKWIETGFPLREHRGDKEQAFGIDQAGWIELSNWIIKQGFEARLNPDREGCLFELRPLKREE